MVEPKTQLGAAALLAEKEARDVLGDDFDRFSTAVVRYVNAVDVADVARKGWEAEGRPLRDVFANGMAGMHPLFKAVEVAEQAAARFGASLGLDPASSQKFSSRGKLGRPVGAVSAEDRKSAPPAVKLKAV